MTFNSDPRDKPVSNSAFFLVIGFSIVLGLYAVLAQPGSAISNKSMWNFVKDIVHTDTTHTDSTGSVSTAARPRNPSATN